MDIDINDPPSDSDSIQKTPVFDEASYKENEKYEEKSLQTLSNCVFISICTILYKRKLIPATSFKMFPVYENIMGYLVDDKDRHGYIVSRKFYTASKSIANKTLSKFALVVEENENTTPVEAFIWHFAYKKPGKVSAEFGYRGKIERLTVDYENMQATCESFCQLFAALREILSELDDLPPGLVPSFKVAFYGEPLENYIPVKEFVNMNQFTIGRTRFPREELHLTYNSKFRTSQNFRTYENDEKYASQNLILTDVYNDDHESIEVTREIEPIDQVFDNGGGTPPVETNVVENLNATILQAYDSSPDATSEAVNQMSELSIQCEPNVASLEEMHIESVETGMQNENELFGRSPSPPKEKSPEKEPMEHSKERRSTEKRGSRKEEKHKPKPKSSRRLILTTPQEKKVIEKGKLRRSLRFRSEAEQNETMETDVPILPKIVDEPVKSRRVSTRRLRVSTDNIKQSSTPVSRKKMHFGRMASVLSEIDLAIGESSVDESRLQASQNKRVSRYGRVTSVLSLSPSKKYAASARFTTPYSQ